MIPWLAAQLAQPQQCQLVHLQCCSVLAAGCLNTKYSHSKILIKVQDWPL